MGNETVTV